MTSRPKAYLEHVAFSVQDMAWHLEFFRQVFGLVPREIEGDPDRPRQAWLVGGLQLVAEPAVRRPAGQLLHLGMMAEDAEAAIERARGFSVRQLEQGPNWLQLPDGLVVEVLQARDDAVSRVLSIDPRK